MLIKPITKQRYSESRQQGIPGPKDNLSYEAFNKRRGMQDRIIQLKKRIPQ